MTVCSGNWDVRDILVDDNRVYFNDFTTGTVLSVPKAGGTTSVVAAPGSIGNQMAMDDTHVYYLGGGDVYRVAKSGGATELIASGATQYALAVDDDYVYWDSPMESVKRVRKPGH